jgi:peptidoglycan/xylan/chitin deacetylase (PgdA/CDA1 family)
VLQEKLPFNERGGKLRGVLDAVSGRFPRFVFGGGLTRDLLPVFHFHDEAREDLEPKLRYLAENGYRSVTSDEIADFVAGNWSAASGRVAICFDDAWASVWTVAAPLLRQYGLRAIVYAIPARIDDAVCCRVCHGSDPSQSANELSGVRPVTNGSAFVTWPELRELHASGLVDVQSHTYSHSRIFISSTLSGFVTPDYQTTPLLNRPQIMPPPGLRFVTADDLGAPIFIARSRMSDGRRAMIDVAVHDACVEFVARQGGASFFERPDWRGQLEAIARTAPAAIESIDQQRSAIESELDAARSILNDQLRTTTVRHVCLPWGVSGGVTVAALKRLGYRTAFANRLRGVHAVRRGDDPLWLKRLPNKYIFRLPGQGRRTWR